MWTYVYNKHYKKVKTKLMENIWITNIPYELKLRLIKLIIFQKYSDINKKLESKSKFKKNKKSNKCKEYILF